MSPQLVEAKRARLNAQRILRDVLRNRSLPRAERVLNGALLFESEAKGHPFKESTASFLLRFGWAEDEVGEAQALAEGSR